MGTATPPRIADDDLNGEATRDLLALHLRGMRNGSPPGHCHVLDLDGLRTPDVRVWSVWFGDALAGVGALKALASDAGEVKSMRTHPDHLRRGVGAALLEHLVGEARRRGYRRLSLETGSGSGFEAALALYRRRGFVDGEAFGAYRASAFNRFLHLDLWSGSPAPTAGA